MWSVSCNMNRTFIFELTICTRELYLVKEVSPTLRLISLLHLWNGFESRAEMFDFRWVCAFLRGSSFSHVVAVEFWSSWWALMWWARFRAALWERPPLSSQPASQHWAIEPDIARACGKCLNLGTDKNCLVLVSGFCLCSSLQTY